MSRSQVQQEWGTAAEVAAFTGTARELVVDITNQRLVIMDGSTVGGFPQASKAYVDAQVAAIPSVLGAVITLFNTCT